MELTDEAKTEFQRKLEKSCVDKRLLPYIARLEKTNYWIFDRLVMLMLNYGDIAFVYGVSIAVALDPNAPKLIDSLYEFDRED